MTKVFQSDKTIKILTVLFLVVLVCSIFMMFASDAFAAGGPDVGKNIGTWLKEQARWLAIGIIAAVAIPLLVKRAWMALAVFIVIAAIVLAVIASPDKLQALGEGFLGLFV